MLSPAVPSRRLFRELLAMEVFLDHSVLGRPGCKGVGLPSVARWVEVFAGVVGHVYRSNQGNWQAADIGRIGLRGDQLHSTGPKLQPLARRPGSGLAQSTRTRIQDITHSSLAWGHCRGRGSGKTEGEVTGVGEFSKINRFDSAYLKGARKYWNRCSSCYRFRSKSLAPAARCIRWLGHPWIGSRCLRPASGTWNEEL